MFEVIWSPEAMDDYLSNIEYLEARWTEREARKFIEITEWTLNLVSRSPEMFRLAEDDVRMVPIVPQITMFYRVSANAVHVLRFWNNYQNPERLRV